jgi:serine/threonine protein kinase
MSTVSSQIGTQALAQQTLSDVQGSPLPRTTVVAGGNSYVYDAHGLIASGADGKVFLGKDARDGDVCIKVAKDSGFAAAGTEYRALSLLAPHASIVASLDYDETSHTLVIERCDTKIDKAEELSKGIKVKAGWIASLKEGVDFMHAKSVAHGDLNMKNMLLKSDQALIADFGGAKIFGDQLSLTLPLDPSLEGLGIDAPTITKQQAMEDDKKDFLKMSFNILAARLGDRELPTGAERDTALADLPSSAREIFFGDASVSDRYQRLPGLLAQLKSPQEVVDLSKLA